MFCGKVEPIVNELAKEYGSKMKFVITPNTEGDAPDLIKQYGLDIHGMVVTNATGAVVWKESGHKQTKTGVTAAIDKLLAE